MLTIEWSDEAQRDLANIQFYIEQRNPTAAVNLRRLIEGCVEKLPAMPYAFRPGRVAGTREYVVHPNYVVVYRVGVSTIDVLRVMHSRQRYP